MKVFPELRMILLISALVGLPSLADASVAPHAPAKLSPAPVEANLVLVFSDRVDLRASVVEVRDANSRRVKTGTLRMGNDGVDVEIPLSSPLAPGDYTIHWRVVSYDGNESFGGYAFTVDPADRGVPPVAQETH